MHENGDGATFLLCVILIFKNRIIKRDEVHSSMKCTTLISRFVRQFATSPEDINALLLGGVPPSLHGAIYFIGNGRFSSVGVKPSLMLLFSQFMYRTPEYFCSVRWAMRLLALQKCPDARTSRANLYWQVPEMHSCLFACYWKVLVGETPTLASCGVSTVRYGSRTMMRNALTRASPTREHDR
jgi:hypothetical protein